VSVLWEVGRNPIYDDPDPMLMAMINEIHEIFRGAVSTRHREVANRLIAPRSGKRMLGDREEFKMGEPHLLAVLDQLMREIPIIHPSVNTTPDSAP
jgi:hypothetical protein